MTTRFLLSIFVLCLFAVSCNAIEDKRYYESLDLGGGETLPYSYLLPDGYDANKTYPVVLGLGTKGPEVGPSYYFRKENLGKHGWIIVESQMYFTGDGIETSRKLMEHLRTKFKVEGNRFYTICYSANSSVIFRVVLEMPEYYSGVIAVPGHPSTTGSATLQKLKNIKVRFLVGGDDGYWLREAQEAHKRMIDLGIDAAIQVFPGEGHGIMTLIGDGILEQFNKMR